LKAHLPAGWKTDPDLALEWWDPGMGIPDDPGMQQLYLEYFGWIVAKHESGYMDIKIVWLGIPPTPTDAGQRSR
jgi:hypothetical protein